MGVFEIISAVLLVLACVFIVLVVLMQDSKQGMSQTITGASADNYYQKNSSRTKEAKLGRLTKVAAVMFFVIALLVNVVSIYMSNNTSSGASDPEIVVTTAAEGDAEGTTVSEDGTTAAEETTAEEGTTAEETAEETTVAE